MRVAYLGRAGHTLPSLRVLLNLLAGECEVVLYSEVPFHQEWETLQHSYRVRRVVGKRWPRRVRDVLLLLTLIRDHLRNRFDVVHAHSTYPAGLVAVVLQRLFGVPAVVGLDAAEGSAFPDIGFGDLLSRNRARLNRWVVNRVRAVFALTEYQRKEVVRNLLITRMIAVIPRGVDLDRFYPQPPATKQRTLTILSVGYLNPIKDPGLLLHAFRFIANEREARLIVVGRDYQDGAAARLAEELGLSGCVRFEGYVSYEQMPAYYHTADVLLHTSRYESQGIAIAEAMASGVVVVGTNVGLVSDLAPTCCVAVEDAQPQALARAVIELCSDEHRFRAIQNSAAEWSRKNNVAVTAERLMKLYKELIPS